MIRAWAVASTLLVAAPNVAAARSIWVDALFAPPALQQITVNPSGTLIAAHAYHDERAGLLIQRIGEGKSEAVAEIAANTLYWWEDDDTLITRVVGNAGRDGLHTIIELSGRKPGELVRPRRVRLRGHLVDPLPLISDCVLWAKSDEYVSSAYRIPIADLLEPGQHDRYRVAQVAGMALHWLSDSDGIPLAVLTAGDGGHRDRDAHLLYRADAHASWKTVGSWSQGEDVAIPVGIAANRHDLLVVSTKDTQTAVLREYLVDEEELGAVIYENPSFDIVDAVFGFDGNELIAVVYEEEGIRRYHYLDPIDAALQSALDGMFPDKVVHLTSRTRDRRFLTVLVGDMRDPGHYYLVDAQRRESVDVGTAMRRIDPALMSPVSTLKVTAKDGRPIEAFLALPLRFSGRVPPLVVMPHGGPIGVSDTRDFDPVVQSLTTGGYAVLQVNYRGSSGKGRGFLEAGKKAWGREIEDDIESALDQVLAAKRVDPQRICIFGASYGGYSALISTTRRPQRYRCAAAVAAPTDLLLMFSSSDFAGTEEERRGFAEIVGDPDRDREHLIEISPAYRAGQMDVPVLLIHGDRDTRVDVEHAYRMKAMLEAHGKPPEWMLLHDATHFPTRRELVRVMERVLAFLDDHLVPSADAPRSRGEKH